MDRVSRSTVNFISFHHSDVLDSLPADIIAMWQSTAGKLYKKRHLPGAALSSSPSKLVSTSAQLSSTFGTQLSETTAPASKKPAIDSNVMPKFKQTDVSHVTTESTIFQGFWFCMSGHFFVIRCYLVVARVWSFAFRCRCLWHVIELKISPPPPFPLSPPQRLQTLWYTSPKSDE
jgi:hypothetical protein